MPTYLYGLILSRNADRVPKTVTGIGGAPLRVIACDELAALASSVHAAPPRQDLESIVSHDLATVGVVRQRITVAASRFGQTFADEVALCEELSPASRRVRATLERYDGYGEMRVIMRDVVDRSVPARGSMDSPDAPGRAYLESVRDKLQPRPAIDFRGILGDLIRDERVERRKDVQTISHLVRFEDEARYRVALYTHHALTGATITGPHALHSFAEAG